MFGRIASAASRFFARRRRALRWVLAAGLVVVGATTAAMLLLNGEAAKAAIERELTTLTGGDFRYAALELRAWPQPTAELQQVTFRVAPVIEGTAERMIVRFSLLRLLVGQMHVARIVLDRPTLVLRPPAGAVPVADDPVAAYRGAVAPVVEWLGQRARGLALSVRDGSVDFALPSAAPLKLDAVMLDGKVSSDAVEVKIAARGSLWQNARLHATIATGSLAVTADLDVENLDAAAVFARVLDQATMRLEPAASNLTLTLTTDGARSANGQLSFATPAFGIMRNGKRLDLGAARARLTASYAPEDTSVRIDELTLGDILTAGSGALRIKPRSDGVALEAVLGRVDAGRVRAAALAVAGDVAIVSAVTSIVRSGIALDLKLNAVTDRVAGLADLSAYDVSMGVEAAAFDIPTPAMRLTGASGRVRIARGVLTAENVAGSIDRSSLREGRLVLALAPTVAVSSLSAALDLDLAENHERVRRLLGSAPLAQEMGRVESIAGRAKGTLSLRQDGAVLRQSYDVTSMNATLRYVGMPLAVAIDSGGVHYETGSALVLRKLVGSIGASRFEELNAEVAFAPGPVVRSASGAATFMLDELYPWLATLPSGEALRRGLRALQGSVGVKLARLAGPLAAPGHLEVDAVLTPHMVHATSPRLPGTFTFDGGSVRVQNQDLVCDGVDVALQDLRATLSGTVRGLATPVPAFDVSIARATVGPRILDWAANEADIPRGARPTAPIRLERTRIRWPAPAPWQFDVAGAASFPGGARSEFDLSYRPGSVAIRRLTLKDQDSDASVTLDWEPDRAGLSFHGLASGRSMARILASPPRATGALRGDFEATVDLTAALPSRATGRLEGTGIDLTEALEFPLTLDRISLEADGDRVRVSDTSLRFADQPFELQGSIARTGDEVVVDGTVTTDTIDTQRWLDRLPLAAADADRASRGKWPVRGRVAMRAGHVDVLGYRLEPFVADLALDERKVTVDATTARLCGIDTPFTLTTSGDAVDLKGRASARDLPVGAAFACLSKGAIQASGTMDITADFAAGGTRATLPSSARGSLQLRARDGRIGGVHTLSGVVSLEEVRERLPDTERASLGDGMSYLGLEIDARLEREHAILDRVLVEGGVVNIAMQGEIDIADRKVALTGIALPIVNALLRRVPVVGRVIGDPVVGIPFSVGGDLANPQVSRVGPTAVAGALLNTLQSVVSLPVQLLGAGGAAASSGAAATPEDSAKP